MCGTCGCKSAESGKKNCGCGQDPCITFGAETFEAENGLTINKNDIQKLYITGGRYGGECFLVLEDGRTIKISDRDLLTLLKMSNKKSFSIEKMRKYHKVVGKEFMGAETFEARENKDGTIVLDGREMANTTALANGNYLFSNKELKWIENNLKSGSEKFHLVKVHSDDVVRCMEAYEQIIRNPSFRRRPPHLDGEKHQRWLKNYRQKLAKNAETTCASCGEGIDEFDIIGDGTNRGLCCVPDYYDDEPEMVHCSFCSKIIGTEKEVYDEETIDYEVANGETICVSCGEEREKELKNDLDPHYSPFYAETEKPFWENITMSSKKKKDFSPLYHGLIAGALGVVVLKIVDRVKK